MLGEGFPSVLRPSCCALLHMAEGIACSLTYPFIRWLLWFQHEILPPLPKIKTTEGGFLRWWHYWVVTGHEGADILVCLQGLGRCGAWLEGLDHWRQVHLWMVYLVLRPFVSSSFCFLAAMALPSWCRCHRAGHNEGCQQMRKVLRLWVGTSLPFKLFSVVLHHSEWNKTN